ncbi:MAG: radical SAM protein, partial [bacterium]
DCFLRDYCLGIHRQFDPREDLEAEAPAARFARLSLKQWPARDEQTSRRAGRENEFGMSPRIHKEDGVFVEEVLLRINYNCNQRCLFCWVEPAYENPDFQTVKSYIEKLLQYKIGAVCITGGEPTLNGNLVEYVSMLKTENIRKVWLQTNAVRLHSEERAAELAKAGLDFALVSLHSHSPEISDMLTGLDGSFEKTVKGIYNLRKNGVNIMISHVINSFNYRSLPEFVEFAASELNRTHIVFSVAAPIYGAMMNRGLLPKLSEIKGYLIRALELCYELRVPFSGLAAMCGIPLCILDGNPRYYPDARILGSQQESRDMIKTDACSGCGLAACCFGLRKNYADFHGTGELRQVNPEGFKPRIIDMWNTDYMNDYIVEKFGW